VRWASLDLTKPRDGRALPRLPHVAMFQPVPVPVPPCPAPPPPTPASPSATPTPLSTPIPPPTETVPDPDGREARTWRYVLKFDLPSRIATMKNALGDAVSIIPSYAPPPFRTDGDGVVLDQSLFQGAWANSSNKVTIRSIKDTNMWRGTPPYDYLTYTTTELNDDCTVGAGIRAGCNTWEFLLEFSGSAPAGDPGRPFAAYDLTTGKPTGGTWAERAPANIIGRGAQSVNWGLLAYSSTADDTCNDPNGTASNKLVTAINPTGTDVGQILEAMRLLRDGGLPVGGDTPTQSALDKAQQQMVDTFAIDPLYQCLRTYGVILVTDGESNVCNDGAAPDKSWGFTGGGGLPSNGGCPPPILDTDNWKDFPPGVADDIWNLALTTPCTGKAPRPASIGPINPRTWVIGFGSDSAGIKCELNYTAYKGRTDANDPEGNAGFLHLQDPRLITCTAWDSPLGTDGRKCIAGTDAPYDGSLDYAFFADETQELVDAFELITSASARGDYATGAPVQGPVSGAVQGQGKYVILSSTSYPDWEGHLYKFDSTKYKADGNHLPGYRVWDAAVKLAARDTTTRRIYTWDTSSLNLVEVKNKSGDTAPEDDLLAIRPALTAEVVDFIRGNDGTKTGTKRTKLLGPLINTVPSIVAAPNLFGQATLDESHATFEGGTDGTAGQGKRRIMVWIGSNDGMLHAFDFETGQENLALIPPQVLEAQERLYANFVRAGLKNTGQPIGFENIYGVAGSLRFGDVFFATGGWRTVGLLTLADGGDLLAAIDITHPYPGDTSTDPVIPPDRDYGSFPRSGDLTGAPVQVIWQKTGTDLPGLGKTWSLPALSPRSSSAWSINFGAGYDTTSVWDSPQVPRVFQLNPVDGSQLGSAPSALLSSESGAWVGNQSFADAVRFKHDASAFASDNIATRGLQADLNGRIWFLDPNDIAGTAPFIGIDASAVAGQSQPLYYPPAAGGQGLPATAGCNVYSFGSGTFYERSTRVNGPETGSTGFVPSLYFAANDKTRWNATWDDRLTDFVLQIPIKDILRPESCSAESFADGNCTAVSTDIAFYGTTLSRFTQMTGAPLLLIDPKGTQPNVGIFVLYDPTVGCNGASYAVRVYWKTDGCTPPLTVGEGTTGATGAPEDAIVKADFAGLGVASGLTTVGKNVFTGIAGLGGDQAGLHGLDEDINFGLPNSFRPLWWKELK
jgi:hypothetical protein